MLARIIDGKLQLGLPQSGERLDGRTVSHYDLLPLDELKDEGWKETLDDFTEGEQYVGSFYDNGENIVLKYSNEI
jgi:hypothetical protein